MFQCTLQACRRRSITFWPVRRADKRARSTSRLTEFAQNPAGQSWMTLATCDDRMKPIRWSAHARKKAAKREISEAEVEQTITQPDSIMSGQPPRQIFMRRNSRGGDVIARGCRRDERGNGGRHPLQDIEV